MGQNAANHGAPASPSDLPKHRLIAFGFLREPKIRWQLHSEKKYEAVVFEPDVSFNDYAAIHRAVVSGQGIAEVPSILCGDALRENAITEILPKWRFQDIYLQALHPGLKNMPRLTRLFLDTCSEHIGAHAQANG